MRLRLRASSAQAPPPRVGSPPGFRTEWLLFPVKYRDLPRNARVVLTVFETAGPRKVGRRRVPLSRGHARSRRRGARTRARIQHTARGGTTMDLFGRDGLVQTGLYTLKVCPPLPRTLCETGLIYAMARQVWPDVPGDGVADGTPGRSVSELERLQVCAAGGPWRSSRGAC